MSFAVQCFKGTPGFPELLFPLKAFQGSLKELPAQRIACFSHFSRFTFLLWRGWGVTAKRGGNENFPGRAAALAVARSLLRPRLCSPRGEELSWGDVGLVSSPGSTSGRICGGLQPPGVLFHLSPSVLFQVDFLFHTVMPWSGCPEQMLEKVKRKKWGFFKGLQ